MNLLYHMGAKCASYLFNIVLEFSPGWEEAASGLVADGREVYDNPFDDAYGDPSQADIPAQPEREYPRADEEKITLHFAKGLCSFFTSRRGDELARIKIPNAAGNPWPSFVVPARMVHDNRYGKGCWIRISANGKTTLQVSRRVLDENGQEAWEDSRHTVDNRQLKDMVEAYMKRPPSADAPEAPSYETGSRTAARSR